MLSKNSSVPGISYHAIIVLMSLKRAMSLMESRTKRVTGASTSDLFKMNSILIVD